MELDQFAENLIKQAGFDKLPEKFQQDFKEQIIHEAQSRLGMLVTAELPEDKLAEYGQLIESGQDVSQFIVAAIPDLADKSAAVLGAYRAEFISEAQKALGT